MDAAISSVNKSLTCPVDNAQGFKDPADKKLESLLKASFCGGWFSSTTSCCSYWDLPIPEGPFLKSWSGTCLFRRNILTNCQNFLALCFAVDALKDSIQQMSCFALLSIHMRRVLWLKNWPAEMPCKRLLAAFPFHGERLFGEDLDKYIQKISGGKSSLLPVKRRNKQPSFKIPNAPGPGASSPKKYRRPQPPAF